MAAITPDPSTGRQLAEDLAALANVPPGGRLELIYDDNLRLVDVFVKPRNTRINPRLLDHLTTDLITRAREAAGN
jgi:hypothetical protein